MKRALTRLVLVAVVGLSADARAYEFWLRAQTFGQAYQLRDYQLIGPDLFLGRRRITQTLALRVVDVGDFAAERRRARLAERGIRISWQSYLRVDHDFGDYTMGSVILPGPVRRDAIDAIPELSESAASLELLYGYLQVEGLFDDRVTAQVGRIPIDDGWGAGAFDGVAAKVALPTALPLAVGASFGLRVRASSPLGVSAYELDGTSGAGCQEYVEGPTPGTGSWQLIDRNRAIVNNRLSSDYEYCPQRDVNQPTLGLTLATVQRGGWQAEIGYRRTWSDTVGLIGPVNRLNYPDLGLYPNDYGQAPSSGIDEERIYARAHATARVGELELSPYADARFSIVHAVFDRADLGVRIRDGAHVLEPALSYFYPTFDSDSIFNAFSLDPTADARLGYAYAPAHSWRATAELWLRHYSHDPGEPSLAGGAQAGVERDVTDNVRARADALWDDGWGGRRVGGTAEVGWKYRRALWVRGRAIVLDVDQDGSPLAQRFVTGSATASASLRVADGVGLHAVAEIDDDAIHAIQTRFIGVLDLAFAPEP